MEVQSVPNMKQGNASSVKGLGAPMQTAHSACMMECGCCFGDTDVEEMVQCSDGHLFCIDCLRNYAKEAIHGQGKPELSCMAEDCNAPFPRNQMKRAMTEELIKKLDERAQEESLNLANLENLFRCPGCHYGAEITDDTMQVFVCPQCGKRTCRRCNEDWSNHEGLSCSQVEKDDETSIRLKYEEKMTEMLVRRCPRCNAPLIKDEGCNKVTCRCNCTICYICRQPNVSYEHFCSHSKPGQQRACKKCPSQCLLWTNAQEDDERRIQELKKEGKQEREERGFLDEKAIGAPTTSSRGKKKAPSKRPRRFDVSAVDMPGMAYPAGLNIHIPISRNANTMASVWNNSAPWNIPPTRPGQQLPLFYPNVLPKPPFTFAENVSNQQKPAAPPPPTNYTQAHGKMATSSAPSQTVVVSTEGALKSVMKQQKDVMHVNLLARIREGTPTTAATSTQPAAATTSQHPSKPSTSKTSAKVMKSSNGLIGLDGEVIELSDDEVPLVRKKSHRSSTSLKKVSTDLVKLWEEERRLLEELETERRTRIADVEENIERRRTDLIKGFNEHRRQLLQYNN